MTYSPQLANPQADRPIITLPFDADYCPVGNWYGLQKRASASTLWTTAFMAVYYEFYLTEVTTVYKIGWVNGTAGTGNICVAIYNSALARQVTTGDVTRSGASAMQWSDIADTTLQPGTYYLGVNHTAITANQCWGDPAANHYLGQSILANVREENVGAIALPATATPVTLTAARADQIVFLACQTGLS